MLRTSLLVAGLAGALFVLAPAHESAPAPAGPGAVLAMHRELFRALDAGERDAVTRLLGASRAGASFDGDAWGESPGARFFVLDAHDRPVAATKGAAVLDALLAWGAAAESTRIVDAWTDCASAEGGFAALEIARTDANGNERRYRMSSLARHENGGWRLFHCNVAPADAPAAKKTAAK